MIAALAALTNHAWLLATAYGSGTYGSDIYSGAASSSSSSNVQIGPITLPVTGAGLLAILGIFAIAVGAGLFVWARQRRRKQVIKGSP